MVRWFLIANASHARLVRQDDSGPLERVRDYEHPESRHAGPPRDRAGWRWGASHTGGTALLPDRDARQQERDRFATELAAALEEGACQGRFDRLAVFAAPSLLGDLRRHLGPHARALLEAECPVDLGHVGWAELGARIEGELQHAGWSEAAAAS